MKTLTLLTVAIALPLVSCKSDSAATPDQQASQAKEEKEVKPTASVNPQLIISPISGYFVKNTVTMEKDVQALLLSSQEELDAVLGVAKTMNNTITPIDFSKNKVAAIFTKPSNTQTEINIKSSVVDGSTLSVACSIKVGNTQSFTSNALKLFFVPREITTLQLSQ